MTSFYSRDELANLGLKCFGEDVLISRKASFYSAGHIALGSRVRIDDFCILSGKIIIGDNVHISAGCFLFAGDAGINFGNFSGASAHCTIYALTDDFSGDFLVNSTIPSPYRNVNGSHVEIADFVQIGTGCTVLPGVHLGTGAAIGAMSLINSDLEEFCIYHGVPARKVKKRNKGLLSLANEYMKENVKKT